VETRPSWGARRTPLIVESFPEEKVEKFGSQTPVNRAAMPKEYGPAFVFLACNEDSSFISGEARPHSMTVRLSHVLPPVLVASLSSRAYAAVWERGPTQPLSDSARTSRLCWRRVCPFDAAVSGMPSHVLCVRAGAGHHRRHSPGVSSGGSRMVAWLHLPRTTAAHQLARSLGHACLCGAGGDHVLALCLVYAWPSHGATNVVWWNMTSLGMSTPAKACGEG
jgi:hypothetical protein